MIRPAHICTRRTVDIALDVDRYDFAIRVNFEDGPPFARIETPAVTIPQSPTYHPLAWGRNSGAGGHGSYGFASSQTQAREEQFAVLRVAVRQIGRHDHRVNGAQPDDDRARFVEPPEMGIARGEKAVCRGRARMVLNGQEQLRRRFVKPTLEEIGHAH